MWLHSSRELKLYKMNLCKLESNFVTIKEYSFICKWTQWDFCKIRRKKLSVLSFKGLFCYNLNDLFSANTNT